MRTNFLKAVIGAPRTGKSTFIKEFCKKYKAAQNKPVVWLTHSDAEELTGFVKISTTRTSRTTMQNLLFSLRNCLIVIDDYLQGNLSEPDGKIIRDLAAFRGHHNNDLILVSHSLNGLPPKVGGLIEVFTFFKPTDFILQKEKKPLIFEDENVLKRFKSLKKCNFAAGEKLEINKHYFTIKNY